MNLARVYGSVTAIPVSVYFSSPSDLAKATKDGLLGALEKHVCVGGNIVSTELVLRFILQFLKKLRDPSGDSFTLLSDVVHRVNAKRDGVAEFGAGKADKRFTYRDEESWASCLYPQDLYPDIAPVSVTMKNGAQYDVSFFLRPEFTMAKQKKVRALLFRTIVGVVF